MKNKLIDDELCFCCGKKNDKGLHLKYSYPDKGCAETMFKIPEYFAGWQDMTHGGLIAMLLDETMAHACVSGGTPAVTVELNVRYKKPVKIGEPVTIKAKIETTKSRIVETSGSIYTIDGQLVAQGKARFLKL